MYHWYHVKLGRAALLKKHKHMINVTDSDIKRMYEAVLIPFPALYKGHTLYKDWTLEDVKKQENRRTIEYFLDPVTIPCHIFLKQYRGKGTLDES